MKYLEPCSGLEIAPGMIKNMEALQSLVHIVVKEQPLVLQEIGLLQKLRKLNVLFRDVEVNWKALVESLDKLASSLRSLSIHFLDEKEHSSSLDILNSLESSPPLLITNFGLTGKLEKLPSWILSLRSLSRFTLRNTGLHAEAIKMLGDLPNLLCLELYHKSYADDGITFPSGKFARLSMLVIENQENIHTLGFEEGSMPNLERLTLSFVQEPRNGISGLEYLQKLKKIEFFGNKIIMSVVNQVGLCVQNHPYRPRVIGDRGNIVTVYRPDR